MNIHAYEFATSAGMFRLIMEPEDRRWSIWLDDERFTTPKAYPSAQSAASDLSGGHCDWPSIGDPSRFAIPDNLNEWKAVLS